MQKRRFIINTWCAAENILAYLICKIGSGHHKISWFLVSLFKIFLWPLNLKLLKSWQAYIVILIVCNSKEKVWLRIFLQFIYIQCMW